MKKAFSWVVTLALLLGLVPGFAAQTAQAESTVNWEKLERQLQQELGINGVWKTYAAKEEPALEDGYYQIGTAAELAWFANYVNAGNNTANAKLVADIDLTGHCWTQIGTSDHPFNGVLDGNHHKISALHISKINGAGSERGLIGQPSYSFMYAENGTLKNVLFEKPILAVSLGINESASLLGCFGNKSDQYSNPSVIDVEVLNAVVYINCEEWGGRAANQSAFPILSMYGGFYKEDTTVDGVFHADSSNREDCGVLRGLYVNGGEFKVSGGTLAKFTTMSEVLCYLETADVYDCVFHVASFEAPDNDKGAHTLVISYWPDIFAEPQQTAKDIDSVHGAYTNLEKYSAADPQSYPDLSYYYSDIYSYDDGNLETGMQVRCEIYGLNS